MPEHYTKATIEASIWCNKCGSTTPWRIAGGKRSHCLTCYEKAGIAALKKEAPAMQQRELFTNN